MNGLVSYGGDPKVTASRAEIERITGTLGVVQRRLLDELTPLAQLSGLVHHIQLDTYIPETLVRLGLQRHGCFMAAESYFTTEARIAHQLNSVASAIESNPVLKQSMPKQVWEAVALILGVGAFTNTNVSALGIRTLAGQLPLEKIGGAVTNLPQPQIQISERPPTAVYQKPTTLSGLVGRLNNSAGNIRIESYSKGSSRVLVVYLPGTAEWNPMAKEKAFDARSDLELLGPSENSSSYRAANAALSAFGATEKDRVILVGYSQGGMVAADIAEHHSNVVGVVTIGSPIASEKLPSSIPVISLEHSNDVVPALAGTTNPITENWATATRHVDLSPGQNVLKAHGIGEYVQTATLADQSTDTGLERVKLEIFKELENSDFQAAKEYAPLKAAS